MPRPIPRDETSSARALVLEVRSRRRTPSSCRSSSPADPGRWASVMDATCLHQGQAAATGAPSRLANPLEIERSWTPDREAMAAALRVVLGLPKQLPDRGLGGAR